jgi:hypothetical protein
LRTWWWPFQNVVAAAVAVVVVIAVVVGWLDMEWINDDLNSYSTY